MALSRHEQQNQANYSKDAVSHSALGLDSTLFLAYRDIPDILKKHLFEKSVKPQYRVLDFGCGAGLSTKLFSTMMTDSDHQVEMTGIDISEENLEQARKALPGAKFIKINPSESLRHLGEFDLVICNFVLVEANEKLMGDILNHIQSLLSDDGIAIITNCASRAYKKSNKWYTFNNDFSENELTELKGDKLKFKEDQPIKVQVFAGFGSDLSFTFFDFFHSGAAYRKAYQHAGLQLLETHKPIGRDSDDIKWLAEKHGSPYKIHIITKQQKAPTLENKSCSL